MIAKEKCIEVIGKAFKGEEITKEEFEGTREAILFGAVYGSLDFNTMMGLQNYSGEDYGKALVDCFKSHVSFRYSLI